MNEISNYNIKKTPDFLPMSMAELKKLGYADVDFVLVSGDAYVDHPSFGAAIIGKILWAHGFTVGIIAQPDWKKEDSFKVFGVPKLGFLVTSGNVDSMVNHFTVAKKRRGKDYYSPNGKAGLRPDRALTVYSRKIREVFGADMPVILGGIEASLRRLSHYDYWADGVRKPVIVDAMADLLVYGMGERQIIEIAELLRSGVKVSDICHVDGTVYKTDTLDGLTEFIQLPSFEKVNTDKKEYAKSFKIQYENAGYQTGKMLVEKCGKVFVVQNTPAKSLNLDELDVVYGLNYGRDAHPSYLPVQNGTTRASFPTSSPVPAIEEVKFSITANRGCFGACNFCALTFHQGRQVTSRGHKSMVGEAVKITQLPDFKGYIHDVGGPTANFHKPSCANQEKHGVCVNKKCLTPEPCGQLEVSHTEYLKLLRELRAVPKIKKVFVRSGIRYDYVTYDKSAEFLEELCEHHISGQLKVAPEHVSREVLKRMGKPNKPVYDRFVQKYNEINARLGKNQFLVPYLMSSHPGSGLAEAIELAQYLHGKNISPEQVQDFYPTPSTVSTCMYYTGVDPISGGKVFTARTPHEKAMQRALIQYRLPQNYLLVHEALTLADRRDLIGFDRKCLIRPKTGEKIEPIKKTKKNGVPFKKKTIRNVHKKKNL